MKQAKDEAEGGGAGSFERKDELPSLESRWADGPGKHIHSA